MQQCFCRVSANDTSFQMVTEIVTADSVMASTYEITSNSVFCQSESTLHGRSIIQFFFKLQLVSVCKVITRL